jgi:hypothetical protein
MPEIVRFRYTAHARTSRMENSLTAIRGVRLKKAAPQSLISKGR